MNVAVMKNSPNKTRGQTLSNSRSNNGKNITGFFQLPNDTRFEDALQNIAGDVNLQVNYKNAKTL